MKRDRTDRFPQSRTEGLIVEVIGDEAVVFDEESKEAHRLSPLASIVFARADGSTNVKDLAAIATERLGQTVDIAQVEAALALLEERGLMARSSKKISRRAMLMKAGGVAAAAWATPIITSIMTPAYAQVSSPDARCPRNQCASQQDGDVFCNTVGVPQEDSCECEDCSKLTSLGIPCPTPLPCVPGVGGCTDTSKQLDGLCILIEGDT
jgi:hypothetical protein